LTLFEVFTLLPNNIIKCIKQAVMKSELAAKIGLGLQQTSYCKTLNVRVPFILWISWAIIKLQN